MLTKEAILRLVNNRELIIDPYLESENIKDSSVMLHLGYELRSLRDKMVDTKDLSFVRYNSVTIDTEGYILEPNQFVLVATHEKVTMPDGYIGWIETRGSLANIGLQSHFCDAHIDPGSSQHINLQLKNNSQSRIKIYPKMYLVKMYLFKMVD